MLQFSLKMGQRVIDKIQVCFIFVRCKAKHTIWKTSLKRKNCQLSNIGSYRYAKGVFRPQLALLQPCFTVCLLILSNIFPSRSDFSRLDKRILPTVEMKCISWAVT